MLSSLESLSFSYEGIRAVAQTRSCTLRYEGLVPVIAREEYFVEIPAGALIQLFQDNDVSGLVELIENLCSRVNEEKNRSLH